MKLPNNNTSYIEEDKMTKYLLSPNHEIGRHKADFFNRFGFSLDNIDEFETALKNHSIEREINDVRTNQYGTKYELRCEIITPDQRNPCIVTVWIIENGSDAPKLITAYPS